MYPVTLQQFKTSNPEKIVTSDLVKNIPATLPNILCTQSIRCVLWTPNQLIKKMNEMKRNLIVNMC